MTAIDCSDCYLSIAIGDGVKRALVRHFTGFIADQLAARAVSAQSEAAHDKIDRDAWRLAARALNAVEAEIEGALDETLLSSDPQATVQGILAAAIDSAAAETKQRYLRDDLFGFASLLDKFGSDDLGVTPR